MSNNNLKNIILEESNGGYDFYDLVITNLEKVENDRCKNVLNPFYDDAKPSLSIFFDPSREKWLFYDHGDPKYSGDVFAFAAWYYDLNINENFIDILNRMATDLKIKDVVKRRIYGFSGYNDVRERSKHLAWDIGHDLLLNEYPSHIDDALNYFSQFGITREVLIRYNVSAVKKYLYINEYGSLKKRIAKTDELWIAYQDVNFAKMYQPKPKRFWYVGSKAKDYVFGLNQILISLQKDKNIDRGILIITGGEKDVLTLASLGYESICLNSETANLPLRIIKDLFPLYDRILVMYDNDSTGQRASDELVRKYKSEFNIQKFHFEDKLADLGGSDVSDYVKFKLDISTLRQKIENKDSRNITLNENQGEAKKKPLEDISLGIKFGNSHNLSDRIYKQLPNLLKGLCSHFDDPINKDLVLLSLLGVSSSFFPKVKGVYDGRIVGTNLYLFVSAPASAGKGVMVWARDIGKKIQVFLKDQYKIELANYTRSMEEFRQGTFSQSEKPEPPEQKTMFIPANTSVSKIVQFMGANRDFGVIFQTEADTLANTFKSEWGDFSGILREAFHHESVTLARRTNNEYIEIDSPKLSVVLSGTPDQVNRLLESVENGFFSRFLFYDFTSPVQWKNQFGKKDNKILTSFEMASEIMLEYWNRQMNGNDCVIYLPQDQIDKLNQYFSVKMAELYGEYGDAIVASVKRTCLVCYRLAMILTAFRILETNKNLPEEKNVERQDMEVALSIVDTLLFHLQRVFRRLDDASRTSKLNSQQRMLYDRLPNDFCRSHFNELANTLGIKMKTAERYLSVYLKKDLLDRPEHGNYRKT